MPATVAAYPVHHRSGVLLPLADLWLDPLRRRPRAVVSHAHADHIARHELALCSVPTASLLRHRLGGRTAVRGLHYGEEVALEDAIVSLHPAGHVLGSSQVLVRHRGVRILYSGDLRVAASLTAEPIEHVACDLLVVDATFGHPHYRFPPTAELVPRIVAFCRQALDDGAIPVLLAYALGKAQEVLAALDGSGLRVLVDEQTHAVAAIYRRLGVALPEAACLPRDADRATVAGHVVVVPPHLRAGDVIRRLAPTRVAMLSGFAVDPRSALRMRCDAAFALSDHADFGGLVDYVERSRAERILTVGGFAVELAHHLRRRGRSASPLASPEQMSLALA